MPEEIDPPGEYGAERPFHQLYLAPRWVFDQLKAILPEFVGAAEGAMHLAAFLDAVAARAGRDVTDKAFVEFTNNVANDWVDLLTDCLSGRGRTALRSSRSLFEESLVAEAILTDPALATRFLDHKAVVAAIFTDLDDDLPLRSGKARRSAEHARRKWHRRWQPLSDAAIQTYGSGFVARWDTLSVRDRAGAAGRQAEYETYRVASATVHGGSGALFGTLVDYPEGTPVHRCGPNLMVCPMSLLYGLKSFALYLEAADRAGIPAAQALMNATDQLRALWLSYERALMEIDGQLWPTRPPLPLRLVAVIQPSNVSSFWLHDPNSDMAIRANPSKGSEWANARVRQMIAKWEREHPDRNVPQSLFLIGANGVPRPGSEWVPASSVFPDVGSALLPPVPGDRVILGREEFTIDASGLPTRSPPPEASR